MSEEIITEMITIPYTEYVSLQKKAESNTVTIGNSFVNDVIVRESIKMRILIELAFNPGRFTQPFIIIPRGCKPELTFVVSELEDELNKLRKL